jgi:DNA invertase Pin-like site-specific DNA recombinase
MQANTGFNVVRSYVDSDKSGLALKNREGLNQLLRDVVAEGEKPYEVILVYDVSRWGRFQDTDEAAHYEFLCKRAGIPVHYCAESFVNDTAMPSLVMKALKRVMAAEYSRELSEKVFQGAKNLSQLGFRMAGIAGYGLRRMLRSASGTQRTMLESGERKSLLTDRVILVPGPDEEVRTVREIFRMLIEERRTYEEIASALNRQGISYFGRRWRESSVQGMVKNPKYMGCHIWGRYAKKFNGPRVAVEERYWVKKIDAFEPIVNPETFDRAQQVIRRKLSNEELLEHFGN